MSALCPLRDAGSGSNDTDLKRSGLRKGGTLSPRMRVLGRDE